MNERPILLNCSMARAIREGLKTMTRRIIKPQPTTAASPESNDWEKGKCVGSRLPKPGDRLWVRENWQYAAFTDDGKPLIRYAADKAVLPIEEWPMERDERIQDAWIKLSETRNYQIDGKAADRKWSPSIHMPRWASILTLNVTSARVERLQDITPSDCKLEGIKCTYDHPDNYLMRFQDLWEESNGKGSWDSNPWVQVIEFKVAK